MIDATVTCSRPREDTYATTTVALEDGSNAKPHFDVGNTKACRTPEMASEESETEEVRSRVSASRTMISPAVVTARIC